MDISGAADDLAELYCKYIQPHLGSIAKITLTAIILLIVLRIILPMIWENILMGIIKISDKKTENEKEDE